MWPHVREHIKRALDRDGSGRYEPPDILVALMQSKAKLWVVWNSETKTADAAVVTELVVYPRLRELRIQLVGARSMKISAFKAWAFNARDTVEAYARSIDCQLMAGSLRGGWIFIGGPGWKKTGVTFEKVLT
jgi:hypothetical protein